MAAARLQLVSMYDYIHTSSNIYHYLFPVSISTSYLLLWRGQSKVICNYRLKTLIKE